MFDCLRRFWGSGTTLSNILSLHKLQHEQHLENLQRLRKLSMEIIELKSELDTQIEKLRESETMFRLAAKAGNDFIYVYDESSGKITWFDSPSKLLDLPKEAISCSTPEGWVQHIHPEDRADYLASIRRRRDEEQSFQQYRVLVGGKCLYLSDRALPVNGGVGSSKWVGAITDYTDIKENEYKFQALSEAGFESIIIHRDFDVVAVNNSFTELTGYTFEEASGDDDFLTTFIRPSQVERVRRRIRERDTSPYRTTIITRSGEPMDVWVRVRYVSFNGYGLCRASSLTEWIDRE